MATNLSLKRVFKRLLASSSDYCLILKLRGVKQATVRNSSKKYIAASFPAKTKWLPTAILLRPRIHFLNRDELKFEQSILMIN